MARVPTHLIAYAFERKIISKLRAAKVPKPAAIAEILVPELIDEIPIEAFDPKSAWEQGILYFHGDVEEDHVRYTQEYLTEAHVNAKPDAPLTLYLSSFGGCVMTGLALASTIQEIRRSGRRVNIHIQGCAMSMGSIIAQVADHRSIEPSAWLMIHEISGSVMESKTSTMRDEAEFMDRLEQQVFALYTARTGKPIEYWRKKMHRRDWFLTAAEALEEGLVDEVKPVPEYPRKRRKAA